MSTITHRKTPATLQRDEGPNSLSSYPKPTSDVDRAAIRRIIRQLVDDPEHWQKMAARFLAEQIQQQMTSTWLERAAEFERAGDTTTAARCRIHAHLLADGDATDPAIADDVATYMAAPIPSPLIAPMRDELLDMLDEELRTARV